MIYLPRRHREMKNSFQKSDIPLELIDDFPDHPFKVRDDEDMMQLVESVKERGVITPACFEGNADYTGYIRYNGLPAAVWAHYDHNLSGKHAVHGGNSHPDCF